VVLAAAAVTSLVLARSFLEGLIALPLGAPQMSGNPAYDVADIIRPLWLGLVFSAAWLYHFRQAGADRLAVGEQAASATLRRWYAYGLLVLGLALLLVGARNLLEGIWQLLASIALNQPSLNAGALIPPPLATMLTGLAAWSFHSRWTSTPPLADDDRRSTLRVVAGFLVLATSVVLALFGASQILYYALALTLGVDHPGGVSDPILLALASPAATVLVFGLAWIWIRRQLARDTQQTEEVRQAGVRRLYTHLVALVALALLATGAAGLLWTLSDQLLNHLLNRTVGDWRDQVSLFITFAVVGAVMWLTHWRPAPALTERFTLSRRLYVYATLLGSVLALLIAGAWLVYHLIGLLLGTSDATSGAAIVDIGRSVAVILVAGALAFYHWRILQLDSAARPTTAQTPTEPDIAVSQAQTIQVTVTGATEQQIREALKSLPPGSRYSLD
jgi:hypothetical protein